MRIVLIWDTDQVGWLVTAIRPPPPSPSSPLISQNKGEMYSSCQALQFTHFPCLSAFPFSFVFHRSGFVLGSAFIPSQPLLQAGRVHFLQGTVFTFWPVSHPCCLQLSISKGITALPVLFTYYCICYYFNSSALLKITAAVLHVLYICFSAWSFSISSRLQSPFLTALLNYNSHIITSTHLKCTIQWVCRVV